MGGIGELVRCLRLGRNRRTIFIAFEPWIAPGLTRNMVNVPTPHDERLDERGGASAEGCLQPYSAPKPLAMDRIISSKGRKAMRVLAIAAALALPASASAPALADDDAVAFAANFADVPPPAAHVPTAGAVDISTLEPDLEPGLGEPIGAGVASYYADKFNGRRTASGETFHNGGFTAAHRSLPFGSKIRVTNPANGKSVVVRINDRGPFHGGRLIDLTKSAASALGIVQRGHGLVKLALVD